MLFSLIDNLERLDIVLASGSPRRYEILKGVGLNFRIETSEFEENNSLNLKPLELATHNTKLKGRSVAKINPESLVISADTIVVQDNGIMGKPKNEEDSYRMLSKLSGKTHQVITAFGMFYYKYNLSTLDSVTTNVTFHALSDEEILAYINTSESSDKAGAYAIQGQGGLLVEKIDGCYYNVVGFPLSRFYMVLNEFLGNFVF